MIITLRPFAIYLIATVSLLTTQVAAASELEGVSFEREVRPILREYCFDCHGANEDKKGNLDLRLVRFMHTGGDSGEAIIAGKPDESLLIERIVTNEMPPGEAHLPVEKLETLRRWIADGAKTEREEPEQIGPGIPITFEDRNYWAFQPIVRPQVIATSIESRARTPIDTLLLQAMPTG